MLESCHVPDAFVGALIVTLCLCWLGTVMILVRRSNSMRQRITDMTLELIGANHKVQQARDQVSLLAHHDPLTGLLVRAELQRSFQGTLALAKRAESIFGIILVDLPAFDAVSAQHGEETANRLLAAFGLRLRAVTRDMDVVARLADSQFAALLPRISAPDDLELVTRKLRAELERPFNLSGLAAGIRLQVCFGHACFPRDGNDWAELMKIADERLARGRILVRV